MISKERISTLLVGLAVVGAMVSAAGICLALGGLLLSENDLSGWGVAMIVVGTTVYVVVLNREAHRNKQS